MSGRGGRQDEDGGGFFARWSRRKSEQRQGIEAPGPPRAVPLAADAAPQPAAGLDQKGEPAQPPVVVGTVNAGTPAPDALPPPPTLADAEALAPGQEVSRFLAPNVDPGVKNAALKKLFTDPHYNVMDGLDTYIDDYNKPDPIPPEMLRQLVQSKFLGLFDDEDKQAAAAETQPAAAPPADATADAQDIPAAASPARIDADNSASHEDADLRLQPDDAAGGVGAREGTRSRAG